MNTTRVLSIQICILLMACAVEAGTMTVSQTRDYQNGGYFVVPDEIIDHSPWQRGAGEDWGWSYDLSALTPADATGIASATLTIKAWSMDTSSNEIDAIYTNSVDVGSLGWDGTPTNWEVFSFSLPSGVLSQLLADRRLDCFMDIDQAGVGHRVTLKYAQLTVVYVVPGADRAGAYDPAANPDSFPDPPSPYWQPGTDTGEEEPGTEPKEDPKEEPSTPVKSEPVILRILNCYNDGRQVTGPAWELWYTQGGAEAIDPCDVVFAYPNQMLPAAMSTVSKLNLQRDVRPQGHQGPIQLSLCWVYGPQYPAGSAGVEPKARNYLSVSLPSTGVFGNGLITLQQISGATHGTYPPYDLRKIIENGSIDTSLTSINYGQRVGTVPLADFVQQKFVFERAYAILELRTDKVSVADYNANGIVDINDYTTWVKDFGVTGSSASDIASLKDGQIVVGIPDGKVDETDRLAFEAERAKYPDLTGQFVEGFESALANMWSGAGDADWLVTSEQSHGAGHSLRAGYIGDNQISSQILTRSCARGTIRFWRKTSCENYFDLCRFFINNVAQEQVSGETDWKQVSFPITAAGETTFEWRYEKDASDSRGSDTVWIDDVEIIAEETH